jgi:hypothetical protein
MHHEAGATAHQSDGRIPANGAAAGSVLDCRAFAAIDRDGLSGAREMCLCDGQRVFRMIGKVCWRDIRDLRHEPSGSDVRQGQAKADVFKQRIFVVGSIFGKKLLPL